jgi:hypothetical protein
MGAFVSIRSIQQTQSGSIRHSNHHHFKNHQTLSAMNATKIYALLLLGLFSFTACTDLLIEADPEDSPVENFELLWKEVNDKYTLFDYKNIDWQAVYQKYRPQVNDKTTDEDLFNVLNTILGICFVIRNEIDVPVFKEEREYKSVY